MKKKLMILWAMTSAMVGAVSVRAEGPVVYRLWQDKNPCHTAVVEKAETMAENGNVRNTSVPTLAVYPADSAKNTGKAVVICPGGGYALTSYIKEGTDFAEWLAGNGITAGVLKYRMPQGVNEIPAEDATRAFELMSENAGKFGVDKDKIGVMGFSAGGHLASTMTVHGEGVAHPAFSVLFYPVITMDETLTHKGSLRNLIGENPSAELEAYYSTEKQVSTSTPPVFIIASDDDKTVPIENSVRFYEALKRNRIPASLHIFPTGGHGWGFRTDFRYHDQMKSLLLDWLLSQPTK